MKAFNESGHLYKDIPYKNLNKQKAIKISNRMYILKQDGIIGVYVSTKDSSKNEGANFIYFELLSNPTPLTKTIKAREDNLHEQLEFISKSYSSVKLSASSLIIPLFLMQITQTAAETVGFLDILNANQIYQLTLTSCVSGWGCISIQTLNDTFNLVKDNVIKFCNTTVIDSLPTNMNYTSTFECAANHWEHKFVTSYFTYELKSNYNVSIVLYDCIKSQIQDVQECLVNDWKPPIILLGVLIGLITIIALLAYRSDKKNNEVKPNHQVRFFGTEGTQRRNHNENVALLPTFEQPAENKNSRCVIL